MPHSQAQRRTLVKPMSFAYSLKHCRHMFRLYFRMIPHLLLHTRLQHGNTGVKWLEQQSAADCNKFRVAPCRIKSHPCPQRRAGLWH